MLCEEAKFKKMVKFYLSALIIKINRYFCNIGIYQFTPYEEIYT